MFLCLLNNVILTACVKTDQSEWIFVFYLAGFPPIPGQEAAGAQRAFADVLEAANKLASADAEKIAHEEEDEEKEEEVG